MKCRIWTIISLSILMMFVVACDSALIPQEQFRQPPKTGSKEATPSSQTKSTEAAEAITSDTEPIAPSLNLPQEGAELSAGTLSLSGAGEPGSEVRILVNEQVVGEGEVNSDGNWSVAAAIAETGDLQVKVQTISADGAGTAISEPVTISVADGEVTKVVAQDATDSDADTAAEEPSVVSAPTLIFPIDGADVLVGPLTLIGSGAAGTAVEILDGSTVIGLAEVDSAGEWVYPLEAAEGERQFAVQLPGDETTRTDGVQVNVSSDTESIDCDFSNPGINRGDTYIVGTCDTFDEVSRVLGIELETLLEANPEFGPNFDLIYPGQILIIPK